MVTQMQQINMATEQVPFKNLKAIMVLGIIETVLGSLIAILGAVVQVQYLQVGALNLAEGICCGIWIIIVGVLGIFAGRSQTTISLINAHLGLSITATIFSMVLLGVDGWVASLLGSVAPGSALHVIFSCLAIFGFISFILLITSSALCCSASPNTCCGSCCCAPPNVPPPQTVQIVTQQPAYQSTPQSQMTPTQPGSYMDGYN
ncbi:unnamed protein product [Clavelina lepadiformis]|uniref:Uncharacterized protein n=1 Tax=Clavelina lepadiformis TaxID=159417 RepID=A0ABP0GMZ4_CLALP